MPNWFREEKDKVEERFHHDSEQEEKVNMATETLSYFQGNKHSPVIVVGEAPDSEDGTKNLLVVRLGVSEVVPASDIRDEEATPASPTVTNTGSETPDELDAQIATLQAKKESLQQPPEGQ